MGISLGSDFCSEKREDVVPSSVVRTTSQVLASTFLLPVWGLPAAKAPAGWSAVGSWVRSRHEAPEGPVHREGFFGTSLPSCCWRAYHWCLSLSVSPTALGPRIAKTWSPLGPAFRGGLPHWRQTQCTSHTRGLSSPGAASQQQNEPEERDVHNTLYLTQYIRNVHHRAYCQ